MFQSSSFSTRVLLCGRSLVASNWDVEINSAVVLITGTVAALAANQNFPVPKLCMIDDLQHPEWAPPNTGPPVIVVGEPAKPAN
jgi:hypothetical protein